MLYRLFLSSMLIAAHVVAAETTLSGNHNWQSNDHLIITVPYKLDKSQAFIKDTIHFSLDTPALEIIDWNSSEPASMVSNSSHTQEFLGYTNTGSFIIDAKPLDAMTLPEKATLFMHYQEKSSDMPGEFQYEFSLAKPIDQNEPQEKKLHTPSKSASHKQTSQEHTPSILDWFSEQLKKLSDIISHLVEKTNSPLLRIITIFILGLLMSLTPCIYPMIPITVGILQTTSQKSLFNNFLLAGSYTLGIATTFACLGLLAAFGGAHFGSIMGNVYFVLFLVAFLAYLAFSMLGFYDMYTPRFMQAQGSHKVNGSYLQPSYLAQSVDQQLPLAFLPVRTYVCACCRYGQQALGIFVSLYIQFG